MAEHPAAALVSAELSAVVASRPPGSASLSLEAPPTWRGAPAAAAAAAAEAPQPLLLCLRCHVKTQHMNVHTRAVGTYMTPVKLFSPPSFETFNAGLAGAPIAALDVATASAAGLALNSAWAEDDRLTHGLRVDVVTGLIAQSSVSQLASWPELSGPPGRRLQRVLDELSSIFSDRPAGAPGTDPNPPPPFVRASAAALERLGAAQTRAAAAGAGAGGLRLADPEHGGWPPIRSYHWRCVACALRGALQDNVDADARCAACHGDKGGVAGLAPRMAGAGASGAAPVVASGDARGSAEVSGRAPAASLEGAAGGGDDARLADPFGGWPPTRSYHWRCVACALRGALQDNADADARCAACHGERQGAPPGVLSAPGTTESERNQCEAVLPDGRVVSGLDDGTLRVWDASSAVCEHVLMGHAGAVTCVAVLPDGRRVASGSLDETLRVWDASSGVCERVLEGHLSAVTCVALLPDGRIVSGSDDKTLRLWDPPSGACERVMEGHTGAVTRMAVLPDGRVVSGSDDDTLRVWDTSSGVCERIVQRSDADFASLDPSRREAHSLSKVAVHARGGLAAGAELKARE